MVNVSISFLYNFLYIPADISSTGYSEQGAEQLKYWTAALK